MSETPDSLDEIARLQAPYRREIVLQDARFDSGMRLRRIRIREGHRFTIMDIDPATATALAEKLAAWAAEAGQDHAS